MPHRPKRGAQSLAVKATELAVAVPQVVAHRVTRMALSGPKLSARDRKEFKLMVDEKNSAFAASWGAMASQAARANQALALSFFRSFMTVAWGQRPSAAVSPAKLQRAALGVLDKGLAPVHRKAVANAKRLSRTKLR
ncbi:MAG: polyhydroxyalkanoate granule-associated phasin [Burkholderiaceae bacterium]